jgi:predicted nucleotidyltransferase
MVGGGPCGGSPQEAHGRIEMRSTSEDMARLEAEIDHLVAQLRSLGATRIILFGSLARRQLSLFSDIDLLVVFDQGHSERELTRWVYQNIRSSEAVDTLAYNEGAFQKLRERPFCRRILTEGRVLYERHGS